MKVDPLVAINHTADYPGKIHFDKDGGVLDIWCEHGSLLYARSFKILGFSISRDSEIGQRFRSNESR